MHPTRRGSKRNAPAPISGRCSNEVLARDDFSSNRHPVLSFCLSMISGQTLRVCPEGKPVPTFPDHALEELMRRRIRLSAVQGCSGAYERLEGILIYFIIFMDIDSAPGVAFKAGVE